MRACVCLRASASKRRSSGFGHLQYDLSKFRFLSIIVVACLMVVTIGLSNADCPSVNRRICTNQIGLYYLFNFGMGTPLVIPLIDISISATFFQQVCEPVVSSANLNRMRLSNVFICIFV